MLSTAEIKEFGTVSHAKICKIEIGKKKRAAGPVFQKTSWLKTISW
ncbi:hypothetical protein SADFL11_00001700 [Roseibium alexandrii DFL-11]|jgi:hypothetical protein|uniref:Uncharacterized protein n=1 Tax=Roseibium alexandrii (strain DSM 17067 / NCIMB 14079 / DFL-11) TaxID=244592 RepID=A0A5E8UXN2_ROSAD|nr:hypothetical protein SADFL11_00001700 [Roseibium alexandrii DFL-11]